MKVLPVWMRGPSLRHVRGGLFSCARWNDIRGVRLTAVDERDKNVLMIISANGNIPIKTKTDRDGTVTGYFIELAAGAIKGYELAAVKGAKE